MKELLKALGDPQNKLQFVHVAGTNGKGSTCAMLASVLQRAGCKTGLFISPYVLDFRERIQVDGKFIPKRALSRLCEKVKAAGVTVTEFEFITAIAFLHFAEQACDVVVLETGLGGRLDATNAIDAALACVITKIDYDHTAILGGTIEAIAAEKCGIIKPGAAVITCVGQRPQAMEVIRAFAPFARVPDPAECKIIKSDLSGNEFCYRGERYRTALLGRHQIENALTVIETVQALPLDIPKQALRQGIEATTFPARLELLQADPPLILDGAHNPNGAAALAAFLEQNAGAGAVAVVGMMADKDCDGVLKVTLPYFSAAITVTVPDNPRSMPAEELAAIARRYCPAVFSADCYRDALANARKMAGDAPVFLYGSLYFAAGVRPLAKNA